MHKDSASILEPFGLDQFGARREPRDLKLSRRSPRQGGSEGQSEETYFLILLICILFWSFRSLLCTLVYPNMDYFCKAKYGKPENHLLLLVRTLSSGNFIPVAAPARAAAKGV